MKHLINGCPIHLRSLTDEELGNLTNSTAERIARAQEELESLVGERVRRTPNVRILHPEYEGPAVVVPPYLMDPA